MIKLAPNKRVLFLTKDLDLIKKQLYEGLNLQMKDLRIADLLDDINTDVMTPAWVCFDFRPQDIAENAYAGLMHAGERVFKKRALIDGNFEVIVSGQRKGTGSSRETASQCERWSGVWLAIAASFAPIHERNNINLGQLMGDHAMLTRLQAGESIPLDAFLARHDPVAQQILKNGGLFQFSKKLMHGDIKPIIVSTPKRPMTMTEKLVASKAAPGSLALDGCVKPGDIVLTAVDGGYSHEFTSAQVHEFLKEEFGDDYQAKDPSKFAVFEDHLIYAHGVTSMAPFAKKIELLSQKQKDFQKHTGVRDYSAKNGISPGICHEVAREDFVEPGDLIQATDSHTCMGGCLNALAYGVGATEYAALLYSSLTFVTVPETIRFELVGQLDPGCTAKDVILTILSNHAKKEQTLNRSMEFGGPGLSTLSIDERATLCNMAAECFARTGICEPDDAMLRWICDHRSDADFDALKKKTVKPDAGAQYAGGTHTIDLSTIRPMVAHPGNPDQGIASDPTNGALVDEIGDVAIDIAYGGSCTAGKYDDLQYYARVVKDAVDMGLKVKSGVDFYIQFGSLDVKRYAQQKGWVDLFNQAGVHVLEPGCGACIGCGPGVSETKNQVTVSAINRNYQGRSGPGKLYLASPLTVAASAFIGKIVPYRNGMFQ